MTRRKDVHSTQSATVRNRTHPAVQARATLAGHVAIMRVDHWFKNVFVLPGIVVALGFATPPSLGKLLATGALALIATCLVASSNYVLNELLDARTDLHHPTKRCRPVPSGMVNVPLAYVQWILLAVAGIALSLLISKALAIVLLALWLMGCVYNAPPIRSKDIAYVDVLSEAVNNPIRMLVGWYVVAPAGPAPISLLVSYWMVGCYFMGLKRFAELREFESAEQAARYRHSFARVTANDLLVSVMFYASAAMLFFGAFAMRYRLELLGAFPLIALVMAVYLSLAFAPDSPVQHPERLYRAPMLMGAIVVCTVVMGTLLFIDLPWMHRTFAPTDAAPASAISRHWGLP